MLLNLLGCFLRQLNLILVLILDLCELVDEVLGMLRSKMMVLRQVLRSGSQLQEVSIECWHFWRDVVEEERLDQV